MRKQKILAIVAACLVATACPSVVSAGEVEQQEATTELYGSSETVILSGDCSATAEDHVKWELVKKEDGKYKIIVSGTGRMFCNEADDCDTNYDYGSLPGRICYELANNGIESKNIIITEVEIREGVLNVGNGAFVPARYDGWEHEIERIILPDGLTDIGCFAFEDCSSLKEINMPNSVTSIGNGSFEGCSSLKEINIPDSVTSIGNGSFERCSSLEKVNIPNGVTCIDCVFSGCSKLKKISIPSSVTSMMSAFEGCESLEEVNIPNGVTSLDGTFYNCSSLKEIHIPNSVASIGDWTFFHCKNLKEICIPDSVTLVAGSAFEGCDGLKELRIPEGVKTISKNDSVGMGTFFDLKNLKAIYLPHSLQRMEMSYSVALKTALTDIYYNGTKNEWDEIEKIHKRVVFMDGDFEYEKDDWSFLGVKDVTVHFLDSEITVPAITPEATATPTPKPTATATPTPTAAPGKEKAVTMYRLYNALNKEHFYTASTHEKDVLVTRGWKYEGVGWYAPEKSNTPVYRLYNPFVRDHHYTTDANEKNVLSSKYGWIYEGIGWYSDDSKGVPLYRRYCPILKSGSHHYTTVLNEAKHLVSVGWKDEGIAWYGLKTEKK